MSTTLKRFLAVLAIAKIIDRVQEARRPKRSPFLRTALVVAAGGGVAYLAATGRLGPVVAKIQTLLTGTEPSSPYAAGEGATEERREIRLPSDAPTAATAPTPTTPVAPS